MKYITKKLTLLPAYPLSRIHAKAPLVFFDIETTGFSYRTSYLYLIGALFPEENGQTFCQWFSESPEEEADVLGAFLAAIPEHACLVHYNGTTFDIPYLVGKCRQYRLADSLSPHCQIDLCKQLSSLKSFLFLPNGKQKTMEECIGRFREDPYDGGALIPLYQEYVGRHRLFPDKAASLLASLLLHNEEDLTGLFAITALLSYLDLRNGHITDYHVAFAEDGVSFTFTLPAPLPNPLTRRIFFADGIPDAELSVCGCEGTLTVPHACFCGKYFFSNYRDYCYLPKEDTAIHKSVAASVEKAFREPATAKTAYQKREGRFLPQPEVLITPAFRREFGESLSFFAADAFPADPRLQRQYLASLLRML